MSFTTAGWLSTATQSYITHTDYFINGKWELVSCVLETGVFSGSHTSERLVQHSQKVVSDFDIVFDGVVAVTHDKAANMVAAARCLYGECDWHSNVCMAHRLQTAVRHAMDMKEVTKVLACSRKLVGHFKHSCLAAEALCDKQVQLNGSDIPLKVIQDAPTRWNSFYYMLYHLLLPLVPSPLRRVMPS